MSYGVKFKLDFADNLGNPRRLEILKKNYSGSVNSLVGTANPVVIKWDSDDDIYTPIIGSTCELNLFVTDTTSYDNWYDADEREYKVRISTGDVSGGHIWNLTDDTYAAANFDWDEAGEDLGLEPYWEGFLIVDRYSEAVTSKPFPIKLVASDGLGTLSGFDAPFSKVVLDSNSNPDPSATQSNFDNLFYYIRKILYNTGLDFDIYIANNIRSSTGANNETLFHDISVYEFGLLKDNFQRYDAKELLEHILKVTNSRVFQSNGRWYIISNSNIIDKRIFTSAPTVNDLEFTVYKNTTGNEFTLIGVDPQNLSLTFSTVDDVSNGTSSITNNIFSYTPTNNFTGLDFFTYRANNGTNNSNTARVDIEVIEDSEYVPDNPTRSFSFRYVWRGNTIQQALSNCRGWTNNIIRTHKAELENAYPNANVDDLHIGISVSKTSSADEKTARWLGIGSKHTVYDYFQYLSGAGGSVTRGIPNEALISSNSYVYDLIDGIYAVRLVAPILTDSSPSGNAQRNTYNISRKYSVSELPSDFQFGSYYIAVFKVVNSEIVERYSFAL